MRESQPFTDPPVTAAFDRGPARYFHGRIQIFRDFEKLLERSIQARGGTTFLIQGAPGAGKSALLAECETLARSAGWKVADIGVGALWDSGKLLDSLRLGEKNNSTEKSIRIGLKNIFGWGYKNTWPQPTVNNILKGDRRPLLLILDEANALGEDGVPPTNHRADTIEVLGAIHNGKLGRPAVLLAAGLGTTAKAFESLKIARFARNCSVELGALGKEAERAVIQDWLNKEGGAKGDPATWIDAIAKEAHGWPHHILSYVDPAAVDQLKADGGSMTAGGLRNVLQAGREIRSAYYEQRARDFSWKQRRNLAELILRVPAEHGLDEEDILESLTQEYGPEKSKDLFRNALDRGIIHKQKGRYKVPIPSMRRWLISNYAREKIEIPPAMPVRQVSRRRDPGQGSRD